VANMTKPANVQYASGGGKMKKKDNNGTSQVSLFVLLGVIFFFLGRCFYFWRHRDEKS